MDFICFIYSRGYDPFTVVSEISSETAKDRFYEVWASDNKHSGLYTEFGTGLLVEVLSYDDKFFIIQTQTLAYIGSGIHQKNVSYEVCDESFEARIRNATAAHWHQPCPAFERGYEHLFADNEGNIFAIVKDSFRFNVREVRESLLDYFK